LGLVVVWVMLMMMIMMMMNPRSLTRLVDRKCGNDDDEKKPKTIG
jgi:uncharacterized membrane protein